MYNPIAESFDVKRFSHVKEDFLKLSIKAITDFADNNVEIKIDETEKIDKAGDEEAVPEEGEVASIPQAEHRNWIKIYFVNKENFIHH